MTESSKSAAPIIITLDPHESLPELLAQVRQGRGRAVVIEIPDHSPILLTATEFRALKDTADREHVTLTLRTEDRLRMQLARMLGLGSSEPTASDTEGWRPEPTALGSSRAFGTWRNHKKEAEEQQNPVIDASRSPRPRRRAGRPVTDGASDSEIDETAPSESAEAIGALDYLDDDPGRKARIIGRIVAVVVVILLIGGIAGWFYLPNVTVRATLKETQVSTSFIYSVAAEGATVPPDAAFSLPAQQASANVPFTISIPATGVDRQPQDTASGTVTLRNLGGDEVTIPAGTQLTNHAGIAYATTAEVKVPGAKDDGATPGETTVDVRAVEPGSSGNQDVGNLSGKIADLNIYYSNRESAIAGGTDTEVKAVSAQDIEDLEGQIAKNLSRAAADGWQGTLADGQAIVPQSVEPGEPTYVVDQKEGDRADNATLSGTVDVTGLIFTQSDVEARSLETSTRLLTPLVPQGYALRPETITYGAPEVLAESSDSVQFQVTTSGGAQAIFDQGAQDALAKNLSGDDWSGAEQQLAAVDAFATSEISRSPGWWPERFPQTADRITVEIDTTMQTPVSSTPEPPATEETPDAEEGS